MSKNDDPFKGFSDIGKSIDKFIKQRERIKLQALREQQQQNKEKLNNIIAGCKKDANNFNEECEKNYYELTHWLLKYDPQQKYDYNYYMSLLKKYIPSKLSIDPAPSIDNIRKELGVIKENKLLEKISKNRSLKRKELEEKAENEFQNRTKEYNKKKKQLQDDYKKIEDKKKKDIDEYNKQIEKRRKAFLSGFQEEIDYMLTYYFEDNNYSLITDKEYTILNKWKYSQNNNSLYLEIKYFSPKIINSIPKRCKYNTKTYEFDYLYYSQNEINYLYECCIFQLTLVRIASIFTIFKCINNIVVNAYTNEISPISGKIENINLLSANVVRDSIESVDIRSVDAKLFFKINGAHFNKKMTDLYGVEPIVVNMSKTIYEKNTIESIDNNLNGFEFEKYSKNLLLANGFDKVEVTKASGDYGADVIAWKDDIKYAIQCKKFSGSVGTKAVQEVIGSMSIYNCHVGVVLTNSTFTPNAKKLASQNKILLWDREKLKEMLKK